MDAFRFWTTLREPKLDQDELRRQLGEIDESNIAELIAFKRALENKLNPYLITDIPVVAAQKLTREQVCSYFGLKNNHNDPESCFPEFTLSEPSGHCSEWLAHSLNLGTDIFRPKYANTTQIINLIIMDVIRYLPGYEPIDHFKPGDTSPARPPTTRVINPGDPLPPLPRLKIRTYKQATVASTIETAEGTKRIMGSIDEGFCCCYQMPATSTYSITFVHTYLVVLSIRRTHWYYASRDMNAATDELSAYLAMIHYARVNYLGSRLNTWGKNYTGYGVISDGNWCFFISLDKNLTIHRSPVLMIKYDIIEIIQYFRHIFTAIVADGPPRLGPFAQRRPGYAGGDGSGQELGL